MSSTVSFAQVLLGSIPDKGVVSLQDIFTKGKLKFPNMIVPFNDPNQPKADSFRLIGEALLGNLLLNYGEGVMSAVSLSSVIKPLVLLQSPTPTEVDRIRLIAGLYYSQVPGSNSIEYMSQVLRMTIITSPSDVLQLSSQEITSFVLQFISLDKVKNLFNKLLDDFALPSDKWEDFLTEVKLVSCLDADLWAFSADSTLYINVKAFQKGVKKIEDDSTPRDTKTLVKLTLASIALHEGFTMAFRKAYDNLNINTGNRFQPRFNHYRQPHAGIVAQVEFFHYDAIDWFASSSVSTDYINKLLKAVTDNTATLPGSYEIFSFHDKFIPGLYKVVPDFHMH